MRREVLKEQNLEYSGACFGFTRTKRQHNGKPIGDLISLYIEDDENWHHVVDFDELWINDLQSVLQVAKASNK
jgi:hypothetical protein